MRAPGKIYHVCDVGVARSNFTQGTLSHTYIGARQALAWQRSIAYGHYKRKYSLLSTSVCLTIDLYLSAGVPTSKSDSANLLETLSAFP